MLSGHTDVVPVKDQPWSSPPFVLRRDGARLYGRGTCDMKGFDALCLAMAPEFSTAALKKPIHILLSYDEETTCAGCLDSIARLGHDLPRPALAIIGEPTLMQVADAHKSVVTYRTVVTGHEAHSSKPWLGVSAVHVACELVGALERIGEDLRTRGRSARPVRARLFHHPCRPDCWRHRAQHHGAPVRIRLGVSRPAGSPL